MNQANMFHALVLAGSRDGIDPVAEPFGLAFKALVPVAGRPMLERVLAALYQTPDVIGMSVVGMPEEAARPVIETVCREGAEVPCLPGEATPSRSVAAALGTVPESTPILVTTADHALLRPEIVTQFLASARLSPADVLVGMVSHESVLDVCPGSRRTVTRFREGGYCGCNLFAILTPAGHNAVRFWQQVENERKHPARIARAFGLLTLLRYVLGRLTMEQAMNRVSELCGARVAVAVLTHGEAAVDVDKPEDLEIAEALARRFDPP
jgi:GTP:adenosylcobinamide-phosphate guanylyltransferase